MKRTLRIILALAFTFGVGAVVTWGASALTGMIRFPETYASGVHYATVNRGNIREELFTSQPAIDAVRAGRSAPSGTVITMEDHRDGKLFRYVVMEKRAGWGSQHPPGLRTGDWEFQAFNADRTVNTAENLDRCRSCHQSQAARDFVFTSEQMRNVK